MSKSYTCHLAQGVDQDYTIQLPDGLTDAQESLMRKGFNKAINDSIAGKDAEKKAPLADACFAKILDGTYRFPMGKGRKTQMEHAWDIAVELGSKPFDFHSKAKDPIGAACTSIAKAAKKKGKIISMRKVRNGVMALALERMGAKQKASLDSL